MNYDAILVVSFGGPESRDDVIPFLENVLRGRNVPRERMLAVAEHYYHFEGKSPINQQTRELIAALKDAPATDFRIPPGMRLYRVSAATGLPVGAGKPAIYEAYKPGSEPGHNRHVATQREPSEDETPMASTGEAEDGGETMPPAPPLPPPPESETASITLVQVPVAELVEDPDIRSGVRAYALDGERAKALWAKSEEMVKERF